jgi:methionyl-tRNA formyltransferase
VSAAGVANAYLGTSPFASEVLRRLAGSRHRPRLVVTPPDRPRGRGRRLASPPAAETARELELPVHQTPSVNAPESVAALRASGAELGCVCAFGQLIGEPLLSELPMINVHPSLLPRWRGAAPIERAIMAGDERTGVSVMRLTEGLDSGPVALAEAVAIAPEQTYGELSAELAALGGDLLVAALDRHADGGLSFAAQDEAGATYAEKIDTADRRLDPARPAVELARVVRALTPHIGAFLELGGDERLGVRSAAPLTGEADPGLEPGATAVADGRLLVGCSHGALAIGELQPAGKRAMASAEWLHGHEPPARLPVGEG